MSTQYVIVFIKLGSSMGERDHMRTYDIFLFIIPYIKRNALRVTIFSLTTHASVHLSLYASWIIEATQSEKFMRTDEHNTHSLAFLRSHIEQSKDDSTARTSSKFFDHSFSAAIQSGPLRVLVATARQ